MSHEQRGKYVSLLCYQHQLGPLTEEQMLSVCIVRDSVIFKKFKQNAQGLYYNERLEQESSKRSKFTSSRRKNLANMSDHMVEPNDVHMLSHMENVNEDVIETTSKTTKEGKVKFLEFVFMTQGQYDQLAQKLGKTVLDQYVERLNNYIGSQGKKYKSHYHTILSWTAKDGAVSPKKGTPRKEEPISHERPDPKQMEEVARLTRETINNMRVVSS